MTKAEAGGAERTGGAAVEGSSAGSADRPPDLTVVIPAFNEEAAVADQVRSVHQVLSAHGSTFEIIVVDDGSTDGTAAAAATVPCRLLRQAQNRGYGAALKRGFEAARSELVIITDADGTYAAREIPALLDVALDYDMVVGSRTGDNVHDSVYRRPARSFLRGLASYLAGSPIPDLNSGLRIIRRKDVRRFRHILPSGFSFTTTITLSLLCTGRTVGYVPIDYGKRIGKSKIRPRHAFDFLLLILRVMVLFNPLKVFLPLGLIPFVAGIAKFVYDIFQNNLSESAVMGILTGIIIWSVGLLADQNARLGLERWVPEE